MQNVGLTARLIVLSAFACLVSIVPVTAQTAKIPLDYKAYDAWRTIQGAALSDDGAWLAYALVPQDGDGTIVARNTATGKELAADRGATPLRFDDAGNFLFYRIAPPAAAVFAARRAGKKPDQMPKSGFGFLNLSTGAESRFDGVKSYALAKHGSHYVAYLLEPPALEPTPAPGPSNKKKAIGSTLVLQDLRTGTTREFAHVTEFAFTDDEKYLAYLTQGPSATSDSASVLALDVPSAQPIALLTGAGRYVKLAAGHQRDGVAFLSDTATFANAAPSFSAYVWDPSFASARVVADGSTPGVPRGSAPSSDAPVAFSKDGSRLFLSVAPPPTPVPATSPPPTMSVDVWNWHDPRLQSEQQVEAKDDAARAFAATVDLATGAYVQLGSAHLLSVKTNDNDAYALGSDPTPYYQQRSWDDFYQDQYAVSLRDGSRRLVARRDEDDCTLSPAGSYTLCFDRTARAWFTVRSRDGRRVTLKPNAPVAFYDEQDDHPALPPPYGAAGWTSGDKRVLVLDRYDVWSFDPDAGSGERLTAGYGRAHHLRFAYQQLDPDATSIDPSAPVYFIAQDERTRAMGMYRLPNASAAIPQRLVWQDKYLSDPIKARHAETVALSAERFNEPTNLWLGTTGFTNLQRASDANPEFSKYAWGSEHLVHYRTKRGIKLDGIVYLPDSFNPHRKYPMLVYFYERYSDALHFFYPPEPSTEPSFSRYVSNGYVVLVPDIAYRVGHPGASALDAVTAAIDAVTARGYVDTKRIGVSGHSWGAYQIAYMLTKTHRFAAAEAGAAVGDMISAYGGIRWGTGLVREFQYETGQSRIGAPPWDRPDLYVENSALFSIKNITTPYLTIANDNDDAVPWYQGIEFFTALRRLHKEAYMFVFNGEYHNLRGREQKKYWTVHLDEFFDHFLKGAPEPAWMSQGVDYLHRGQRNVRPLYGETP